ncbi:MAG: MFS transporter [Steroidobacteraceae bacterium]
MSSITAHPEGTPSRVPLATVALLSAALLINYVDRGSISTAAPLLEREFHLAPMQTYFMLSAFFWAYVPSQPLMGWLADTVGAARVLAGGVALWSISTVLAGASASVVQLVALRLLMGVGESTFYPSALALLAQRVSDRHRGRATAVMQFGAQVGPALGALAGGLLMVRYGWRAMFIVLGLASLLWLLPWSRQLRATRPVTAARAGGAGPSFARILRQRALWGTILGNFCSNYGFYFVFTALPLYLVNERGLGLLAMTRVTTAFYVVDAASCLATGWVLDAWIRRGATASRAYKTALALSAAGVGTCLIGASGAGAMTGAVLLVVTGLTDGLNNPSVCALTQRFAGPLATGRWMGVQNATSNTAGIIAPIVTGYLLQASGHYTLALWVTGAVALTGLIAWLVIVPAVEPVDWGQAAGATSVAGQTPA